MASVMLCVFEIRQPLNCKLLVCLSFDQSLFSPLLASRRGFRMDIISPTDRTALKRLPQRGSFEREQINQILDEGMCATSAS